MITLEVGTSVGRHLPRPTSTVPVWPYKTCVGCPRRGDRHGLAQHYGGRCRQEHPGHSRPRQHHRIHTVGYPVEFPEIPLLEAVGWKQHGSMMCLHKWLNQPYSSDVPTTDSTPSSTPTSTTDFDLNAAAKRQAELTKPTGSLGHQCCFRKSATFNKLLDQS